MRSVRTTSITVGIPVSDLERSRGWYDRVLSRPATLEPAPGVVEYEVDGIWVQLHESRPSGGQWVLRFGVEDLDAERDRLLGLGLPVSEVEEIPGAVRIFELTDPDLNHLSFYRVVEQ